MYAAGLGPRILTRTSTDWLWCQCGLPQENEINLIVVFVSGHQWKQIVWGEILRDQGKG